VTLRAFRSLHFKIASGVILTVVLLSTLYFAWDYRFHRRRLLEELEASAVRVSEITRNSLLEVGMLGNHPDLLQKAVQALGTHSSVHRIAILDLSGRVHFSSRQEEVGQPFPLGPPGMAVALAEEPEARAVSFHRSGELEILRNLTPIPNRRECRSCHDPTAKTLGVLVVDFPTGPIQERLVAGLYEMLAKAGLTLLAILAVLGVLLNRMVIGRIKRLTAATTLSRDAPAPVAEGLEGPDEIGRLARSFNLMSADIRAYCRELEEKEEIRRSLLDKLVRTQEEERKTISRELHDRLGQGLSALLLAFQNAVRKTPDGEGSKLLSEHAYSELERMIRELIDKVHRLAWEMRPSILDDYGLESAMARYLEEVSRNASLDIDWQSSGVRELGRLPMWVETTLYRVTQEAITNILRHSHAGRAGVVLLRQKRSVTLLIEDDGVGFDPARVEAGSNGGLGLSGMRERVSLCGGELAVESAPGKGTTIRVRIPLTDAQEPDPAPTQPVPARRSE
jgi:signal transduction histidine kinase